MGQDRSIKSIWVPDIEDYQMRRLDEGAAPSTVNKEKAALSKMFNVLIKLRLIEVNPAKLVKNLNEKSGEREVYLSHKDFRRIVAAVASLGTAYCPDLVLHGHETRRSFRTYQRPGKPQGTNDPVETRGCEGTQMEARSNPQGSCSYPRRSPEGTIHGELTKFF